MKHLITAALILGASGLALAQTLPEPKARPGASRVELNSTAKNMAAGIEAAEKAMTAAELVIADAVYVGRLACELGAYVTITADPKARGYFDLQTGNHKFRMVPVVTSTGAIRLEDQKAGGVWLQLSNKSMLMSQKLGARLADECMGPAQMAVAERLKTNPAPSLLEPLPTAAK